MLAKEGARTFKIHGGDNPFQEVGIPDILCCYHGVFIGLEAKEPGNSPSSVQKMVLHEIVEAGGFALVFTTVEQVKRLLGQIDAEVRVGPFRSDNSHHYRLRLLNRSISST